MEGIFNFFQEVKLVSIKNASYKEKDLEIENILKKAWEIIEKETTEKVL